MAQFWADGFWAAGFWAEGFWAEEGDEPQPELTPEQAYRLRRAKRFRRRLAKLRDLKIRNDFIARQIAAVREASADIPITLGETNE